MENNMTILHRFTGNRGLFYLPSEDGEEKLAQLVYTLQPPNMIIEHTEVDKELRGHDIGYKMVEAAVNHARNCSMKIMPVCPFAAAIFQKKPDFSDVLAGND